MSLSTCAAAALAVFPNATVSTTEGQLPLPAVMLAIGGAESGWDVGAQGDYGLSGPSCHGYTSWGWLQIHAVHAAYLQSVTGSASPCAWATWLFDPTNCARAALAVLGAGPDYDLAAWTTYTNGQWRQYLAQARGALASAVVVPPQSATTGTSSATSMDALFLIALATALGTVGAYEGYQGYETLVRKHGHSALPGVTL